MASGLARCDHCRSIFDLFSARASHMVSAKLDAKKRVRGHQPMPKRYTVEETPSALTISWRWLSWNIVPALSMLGLSIWSFLDTFYWPVIGSQNAESDGLNPLFLLGPFALAMIIYQLVNRTRIRVTPGVLSIRQVPFPWFGNKTIPARSVKQLYCKEHEFRSRHGVQYSYALEVVLSGGRRRVLFRGFPRFEQVLYLEQQIESYLDIDDREVDGETLTPSAR